MGLNFESTVQGGSGPSFATGNTRMGSTAAIASDPANVRPLVRTNTKPVQPVKAANRQATRLPTAKSKLVKPKRRNTLKPTYPSLYREQGLEGKVIVEVEIDARGKVTNATIIGPSKHKLFNEEARRVALKQEFSPATRDGVAISFRISFSVSFRLSD